MPITIPGLPDNVVAIAYRAATEGEHWFEPSGSDDTGLIHPGPSVDVVLVIEAVDGYKMRYDIGSDTNVVVKEDAMPVPDITSVQPPASQQHSFSSISNLLLSGTVKQAARATWKLGRHITYNPAHAPHFTTESGWIWAYRSDDLRARDWTAV